MDTTTLEGSCRRRSRRSTARTRRPPWSSAQADGELEAAPGWPAGWPDRDPRLAQRARGCTRDRRRRHPELCSGDMLLELSWRAPGGDPAGGRHVARLEVSGRVHGGGRPGLPGHARGGQDAPVGFGTSGSRSTWTAPPRPRSWPTLIKLNRAVTAWCCRRCAGAPDRGGSCAPAREPEPRDSTAPETGPGRLGYRSVRCSRTGREGGDV